jgi:hypothetical protein
LVDDSTILVRGSGTDAWRDARLSFDQTDGPVAIKGYAALRFVMDETSGTCDFAPNTFQDVRTEEVITSVSA